MHSKSKICVIKKLHSLKVNLITKCCLMFLLKSGKLSFSSPLSLCTIWRYVVFPPSWGSALGDFFNMSNAPESGIYLYEKSGLSFEPTWWKYLVKPSYQWQTNSSHTTMKVMISSKFVIKLKDCPHTSKANCGYNYLINICHADAVKPFGTNTLHFSHHSLPSNIQDSDMLLLW